MAIKPGTPARLIQPEVKGVVTDTRWVADRNTFECLLEYTEGDGSVTQRWLDDDQLEVLPAAPANTTPEAV